MIKEINSKTNAKIKYIFSLHSSKYRKENNEFLAEGIKSLEMAISADFVKEIYTLKPLLNIPENIPQYIVNEEIMEKISFTKSPEGIVFLCKINAKVPSNPKKIVYLDHVNDPGNAGTIIRTALAFGYDEVVFSSDSVDIYNEKAISATKGAIFAIPVIKKDIDEIKDGRVIIASTLSSKSIELEKAKIDDKPFVLVLGNESHGISEEVKNVADILVKIPMKTMESLNVSIAAGILMYHFR